MEFRLEDASPLFRRLVPMLDRVTTGFTFTEGPVWRGDDLLFSDLPNSRTTRYRPLAEGAGDHDLPAPDRPGASLRSPAPIQLSRLRRAQEESNQPGENVCAPRTA